MALPFSFTYRIKNTPNLAKYEIQQTRLCAKMAEAVAVMKANAASIASRAEIAADTTPLGHGTPTYTLKYGAYPIETGLYWAKCRELRDNWNAQANDANGRTCVKEEAAVE